MREIIEQDLCAECAHLRPSQPLPTNKNEPPFGVFSIQCDCAEGWPRTKVSPSANAISECPKFSRAAPPAAASGQAAVQEVQPVAWMHEFTDPHDGQRRCEPRRNKPADYELLPGDTVRPLVYAAASQPSAQTDDALEVRNG